MIERGSATPNVVESRMRSCGIGPWTSIRPPAIIATIPPIARMPWLVTVASKTNKTMASRINAAPAQLTGNILNANRARIRLMPPMTPGRIRPG